MASGALTSGIIAVVLMFFAGIESFAAFILGFLLTSAAFDVFLAWSFEAIAPTSVTIRPGEKLRHDSALEESAVVVSGFGGDSSGRVRVRGEDWTARRDAAETSPLVPGSTVKVVGRDGLTLLVSVSGEES